MSDLERVRIAALALLLGFPALPAMAQEVGKASAVNPAATANLRTITIGSSITHKERIKTATAGSVQILFVDKTSMTIGPNSDLTIDEYVYDPNAGTGKLAATLGKGALRFVGGQISHSGDAEIKTASAVIGIRGGVALISPQNIYAGYGSSTVSSGGGTVTLGAGEFTQVGGGGPPSPPGPPPPNFVAGFIQQFQSAGGQTGGAPRGAASPANVARAESRATGTNGGAVAGQLTPPVINQMPQLTSTPGNNLTQTIQTTTQQSAVQSTDVARPTITLSGFIGGLMQTVLVNNYNYSYYASISTGTVTDGTATVALDAGAGRVQAKFAGGVEPGPNASYLPSVFEYHYDSQGDYADYNNFVALPATGAGGQPQTTINELPVTNETGAMVAISPAQAGQLASLYGVGNATACDCDYTRWGFWTNQSTQSPYLDSVVGYWVAGRPTTAVEMPLTGQATYAGHVVAAVQNQNSFYFAAGNFNNTVNFGNQTGQVTVTGLDSTNYAGQVQFGADPRNFSGTLAGNVGSRSMALDGSFFRGISSPVGEMGGRVSITGADYLGGGIFAAKMK
uniref:FecR protein domain-containing protein n=1 Tax=Rhodopseudomonas palustris (strain BisA53) TaxID=316055 RepID=Q07M95_RHOP5